jgi:hypothetical protein
MWTGVQLQFTPPGALVVAATCTLALAVSCEGGGMLKVTVTPTTVMAVVLAVTLELSARVAVMTTGLEGTVLGAV